MVLCLFWMNPFFWLMRRELNMIHEFLVDRKAISTPDGAAFAQMILQAVPASPVMTDGLVNPFFFITNQKKINYDYYIKTSKI